MRPPALYNLPFYVFFFFFFNCSLLLAAAGGVEHGRQGDNHNITGGEAVVVTSTALVPFALFPGVHVSRGRGGGGHLDLGLVAPSPPSPVSSGAFCLACFPVPGRRVCFLMVGNMFATPRRFNCSSQSRRWSSSSSNASSAVALLHKYGDHVASARAHSICNEVPSCSWDRPSNASFLPTMKLGKNLWATVEYYRSRKRFHTGSWDGKGRVKEFQVTISSGPADVKVTFGYISWLEASFSLVTTGKDGVLQRMAWGPSSPAMNSSLAECAAFGLMSGADAAGATPFCICLTASRPMSPMDWGTPGTSSRLNASLYCGKSTAVDSAAVASDVDHRPDASKDKTTVRIKRCRLRCVANFSCLAFAAVQWGEDSRCITWTPTSEKFRSEPLFYKSSWATFVTVIISWITASAFYFLLDNMIKKWRTGMPAPCQKCSSVHTGVDMQHDGSIVNVASMNLSTVIKATRGFAKRNIIGKGGFAIVYKGKLSKNHVLARDVHKREIAVKRLKQSALSLKGSDDFEREVELMSKLDHGNLVQLVAYCVEGDESILVYEYMQNKSLDGYIFGTRKLRASLNWAKRLEIIHGIAQGVSYLHEGSGQNVIHRDLKPSNVLLDHKWTPKIADFGTTKLLVADDTETQTIVFSPGYAAPEYIRGDVTLKCDVYSFGVVLLEIISGRRNITSPSLLSHAWKLWDEHTITDLFDPLMTPPRSQSELCSRLRRCIQIGLLCVQESPGDRPTMPQVLAMLTSSGHSEPRKPKAPAVFSMTSE